MADLRDIGSSQYAAVTGRRLKTPYTATLTGQAPVLREAARQKTMDDLRQKELDDTARRFDATQALEREKLDTQKSEAATSNIITGTGLSMTGAYMADRAGLINLKDIAAKWGGTPGRTVTLTSPTPTGVFAGTLPGAGTGSTAGAGAFTEASGGAFGVNEGLAPVTDAATTEMATFNPGTGTFAAAAEGETVGATPGASAYALPALAGYVAGGKVGQSGTGRDIGEKVMMGRGGEREHGGFTGGVVGGLAGWGVEAAMVGLGMTGIGLPLAIGLGAIAGIAGGSGNCVIVTACTSPDSPEVKIAREYRDKYLDHDALKGYYQIADRMVPQMEKDEAYRDFIKKTLVNPLLEYGQFCLGRTRMCSREAATIAEDFIEKCRSLGQTMESYTRTNGEVI